MKVTAVVAASLDQETCETDDGCVGLDHDQADPGQPSEAGRQAEGHWTRVCVCVCAKRERSFSNLADTALLLLGLRKQFMNPRRHSRNEL